MEMQERFHQKQNDPEGLEQLYQQALRQKSADDFSLAVQAAYTGAPDNPLFAAWHYRLGAAVEVTRHILWKYAIPLSVLCGLIFWFLSDMKFEYLDAVPLLVLLASPVAAIAVLAYLSLASRKGLGLAAGLSLGLIAFTAYALLMVPGMPSFFQDHAVTLMLIHLPVLSLATVGIYLTGLSTGLNAQPQRRFAFVIKTFEVVTTGGLFAIAIAIFGAITFGLFDALGIQLSEVVTRLIFAGGGGMLPVLTVAIIYNPHQPPEEQDFSQGLSRFLANLLRIMILPTLFVAVLYVLFIPFNFMEPFNNRDVLFIYNGMLFAVMALLVGATPIHTRDLPQRLQVWLRYAILAVAALAVLVSLYALAAILYRTFMAELTMNRLTVIGWNVINISVLVSLLFRQFSRAGSEWALGLKQAFNFAAVAYSVWAAFLVLAIPLLFR
ncbi:MAG TPA: hypothetical protein VN363_06030 [Anaerolineales bacterium]|nr:hypothetical protein [Anaerolineales bacterium]